MLPLGVVWPEYSPGFWVLKPTWRHRWPRLANIYFVPRCGSGAPLSVPASPAWLLMERCISGRGFRGQTEEGHGGVAVAPGIESEAELANPVGAES